MSIYEVRVEILKSILEFYQNTEYYDRLLDSLNKGETIADLLKGDAVVYHIMMSSTRLIWNGDQACGEYGDYMARYQKGYQLYLDYTYYFLGAIVVYPSLDFQIEENLKDLSLVSNDVVNYQPFLENISLDSGIRSA